MKDQSHKCEGYEMEVQGATHCWECQEDIDTGECTCSGDEQTGPVGVCSKCYPTACEKCTKNTVENSRFCKEHLEEHFMKDADQKDTKPESCISILSDGSDASELFRIERDGKIIWIVNGEKRECEDFKDLAKAFMYTIYSLAPETDWKGLAPDIYEEIKPLIESSDIKSND